MLLPHATTPAQVAATYCLPFDPSDPLMDLYNQAAVQFDSDNDPSLAALIVVSLQNRMTLYRKAQCTDCAEGQNVPTFYGNSLNEYGAISTGLNDFYQAGSQIANSVVPGSGVIVQQVDKVVQSIVGVFTEAHAKAVAKEQAVNCAAAQQFNTYIPALDKSVASGQVDAQTGIQTAQQLIDVISQNLQSVVKAHNWGWGAQQVLQAQLWFRQQWYPQIAGQGLGGSFGGTLSGRSGILLVLIAAGVILLAGKSGS